MTQAYPLHWPSGLPPTEKPIPSAFKTGLTGALKNVKESLRLFGQDTGKPITDVVLSSNVGGLDLGQPKDCGVAAWFVWDGEQRCIAIDRYRKVEENLQAIHHIIEARRTEMRHGGLHIVRQTFKGFTALPAPEERWWAVLNIPMTASADEIKAAYRKRAAAAHPDTPTGSHEAMSRLNAARDEGLRNVK